jgi:hypothetical protein
MNEESNGKNPTVAYVPFKTFLSSLELLEQGLPPHVIDRSVFPSFSGIVQSQLLGAFRFLGLIDAEGKPTPDLEKLVTEKDSRKANLRKLLERSYADLVKRDLTRMTAGSFQTAMREYGVSGSTFRRSVSFFLQAAKYSDLPLSPYILRHTRNASSPRKRPKGSGRSKGDYVGDIKGIADNGPSTGPVKTINLQNGITMSLSTSADTFQMTSEDREFVLRLLEQIEKYETEHKSHESQEGNA